MFVIIELVLALQSLLDMELAMIVLTRFNVLPLPMLPTPPVDVAE